ncbi:MAG: bifunctional transaldolase/phosoglucose isomerase [Acidobacteria bacterium]|nr:bifunctional transaldolase/phosoglucose isomerase [Acidobacteriota bacterium]
MNPILSLAGYGQSVWLDYIRRHLITSGELQRLVAEDGLAGVTSNPAIFERAIAGSSDYAEALARHVRAGVSTAKGLYEALAIEDIQMAADVLHQVFLRTSGRDGFVSLEVSPELSRATPGTLDEARRLWHAVGRENVMIKVPATPEGIVAIQPLIAEAINVNVTLLFSVAAYERVAEAYLAGLEARLAAGLEIGRVASVASFFVSRIDTAVDAILTAKGANSTGTLDQIRLAGLLGKTAVANARQARRSYLRRLDMPRWRALAERGAMPQRLLWASTGTKNPAYPDTKYVEELIGRDTVNTIPPATYDAFRAHGRPRASLDEAPEQADQVIDQLEAAGISLQAVGEQLLASGLGQFSDAFRTLLAAVGDRCATLNVPARPTVTLAVGTVEQAAIDAETARWTKAGSSSRLWAGDASLWTGHDEASWLGWLTIVDQQHAQIDHLEAIADDVRSAGFSHALLLGMGGSSLAPEVFRRTFGRRVGFPDLHILDSTDPAQIAHVESQIDLANTVVIVSSKSGSTLEPNILLDYFYDRVSRVAGAAEAPRRFIAVTDPGSLLARAATERGFRHIACGVPSIGGRYSALSDFGLVPAAVMGIDLRRLLERAARMVVTCAACVPPGDNPGVRLGIALGALARGGRDKLTLVVSPAIGDLGAWLEQLIAESTGKAGRGIVPIDLEPLGAPHLYRGDRTFVYIRLEEAPDAAQDVAVVALEQAGHAVLRVRVDDAYDLGQEFFRWEIATAVAGAILGINPFDQPDVEASKVATRRLTDEYDASGSLPADPPFCVEDRFALHADAGNAAALMAAAGGRAPAVEYLRAHLGRVRAGDYVALLAYVPMSDAHRRALQNIRRLVRDRLGAATCVGFGPRFLHSTGQVYKGGPNTGVFIQVTCDDAADLPVPGRRYTFGIVKAAQARGDLQVLAERGRRALRVHLGPDVAAGLASLGRLIEQALGEPA